VPNNAIPNNAMPRPRRHFQQGANNMIRTVMICVISLALAALLAQPATAQGVRYWPDADLKAAAENLAPKINEQHFALDRLGDWGSHYALMVHREGNGPSEIHDQYTDFYVVQSGEGTLITGGEIVDAKTTEPGEIRGTSVKGGTKRSLKPGDTVNIPPKTPHQVVVESGKTITYLILKVKAQ